MIVVVVNSEPVQVSVVQTSGFKRYMIKKIVDRFKSSGYTLEPNSQCIITNLFNAI